MRIELNYLKLSKYNKYININHLLQHPLGVFLFGFAYFKPITSLSLGSF